VPGWTILYGNSSASRSPTLSPVLIQTSYVLASVMDDMSKGIDRLALWALGLFVWVFLSSCWLGFGFAAVQIALFRIFPRFKTGDYYFLQSN